MTPHNEAQKEEIAKTVIMTGDPLRAKYIAENYFDDYKLVNTIRGMYCYTGLYKGKRITVMAHGMGIPSMGIYSYELFHFYDVDNIIRVGSCGAFSDKLKIFDIVLVDSSYTESNYAYTLDSKRCNIVSADENLNKCIEETAKEENISYVKGTVLCNECFDPYIPDKEAVIKRVPEDVELIASEMESFALFYNAKREEKRAACLLTVTDVPKEKKGVSAEERKTSLDKMIKLALETVTKIKE